MSSSVRWGGLRPDPYNPNAFDADGDGIVQEGTAFERPAGTRILDEFGRNIASGITSEMRPSNWRVVDRDGNTVSYVPTYERARSQPVSNSVGTIGSRVGTIGDRVGTIGDRARTLGSSVGTVTSLPEREDVPRVVETPPDIPEYVEIDSDEIPDVIPSGANVSNVPGPRRSETFAPNFDDPSERVDLTSRVSSIQKDLLRKLRDVFGDDSEQFVEVSDFMDLNGDPHLYSVSNDNWIDDVEQYVRNADISDEQKNTLQALINDTRVSEEMDSIATWLDQSQTQSQAFSDPFALPPDPFALPSDPLSSPPDPFTGETFTFAPIQAPYDQDEARQKYMEAFSQLSTERRQTINNGMLERLKQEEEDRYRQEREKFISDANTQASYKAISESEEALRRMKQSPDSNRNYSPSTGQGLAGSRDRNASEIEYDPASTREVSDIQEDADSVLVKAGDLTSPEHEQELIDFLISEKISEIAEELSAPFDPNKTIERLERPGIRLTRALIESRQFDGDALTVTPDEVDELIANGYREMSRGGSRYPNEQFLSGEMLIGDGIDGSGLYFATETFHPDIHGSRWEEFNASVYAGMADDGTIIRGALNPSAKVIDIKDIQNEIDGYIKAIAGNQPLPGQSRLADLRQRLVSRAQADSSATKSLAHLDAIMTRREGESNYVIGIASLLMGADAINDGEENNRSIVYNRSAIMVTDQLLSSEEFDSLRGYEAFKERYNQKLIDRGELPLDPTREQVSQWRKAEVERMIAEFDQQSETSDSMPPSTNTVLQGIRDAGGSDFARPDEEYVKRETKEIEFRTPFKLQTTKEKTADREKTHAFIVGELKRLLQNEDLPVAEDGYIDRTYIDGYEGKIHPDVREFILNSSPEEVSQALKETAKEFHDGVDRRIRVRIPGEGFERKSRLNEFLSSGRYKTTHQADSDHSDSYLRTMYETTLGIGPDTPAELRPASGYVVHPALSKEEGLDPESVVAPQENRDVGHADIYGNTILILKEDVADRSAFGLGDSLNYDLKAVRFDEEDSDLVLNALASPSGKAHSGTTSNQMLALLEARRRGSFDGLNSMNGGVDSSDGRTKAVREYFEAIIPGSFTIDDVEEIRVPIEHLSAYNETPEEILEMVDREFFTTEKLRMMGLSEEEIAYVLRKMSEDDARILRYGRTPTSPSTRLRDTLNSRMSQRGALQELFEYRKAKQSLDYMNTIGPKIRTIGTDPLDPKTYGGSEGDSVENMLLNRVYKDIKENAARALERESRPSAGGDEM